MTHYLYILYSPDLDRYYIGESENPEIRLKLHNEHHFKKSFTKAASDWKIVLNHSCHSKEYAIFLEKFIKRMKSRKFILKILDNQNILDEVLKESKK